MSEEEIEVYMYIHCRF